MDRIFLTALALTALPLAAGAGDGVLTPGPKAPPVPRVLPLVAGAGDGVVRLKVRPMPAPKPVLQYLLLPEVGEMNPGNPAQWYLRCFAERRNFFFTKEAVEERTRYLSMPLAELERATAMQRQYGGSALTEADWAARLDALDWQVTERVQTDGLALRQPELEPLRTLATALKVRFRIEVAGRRFDDAVRTAKTMFALARHLGENPTHAANQVGLFAAHSALDVLEEMVQQPGCPNLYWALTDLPTPLVDMRKGFQGERRLLETEFHPLRADAALSAQELEKVVGRLSGIIGFARMQAGLPPHKLHAELIARTKDAEKVRTIRERLLKEYLSTLANRRLLPENRFGLVNRMRGQDTARAVFDRLLELGQAKDLIRSFPPLQVILLEEKRQFATHSDERMKLLALAPWQIDKLGGAELERETNCLLAALLPPVLQARREQGRLEQRIALLRYIEALRLYAADHEGKLPSNVSAIAVPLPNDPFTGKAFVYRVEGATAHLRNNLPHREEKNADYNVHYEVTLEK
jgi:hypothetical protein